MTPAAELQNITKRFGAITANNKVNFTLMQGEIHSIVGGNGAGKSTLVKILYGMLKPDSGTIIIKGLPLTFDHPKDSIIYRLGMVHQEMLLIETKTVLENIILGAEPVRFGWMRFNHAEREIKDIIEKYKLNLEPGRTVSQLTVGERQRVLIARLMYQKAEILILDEPTAALTPQETDKLFNVLRTLTGNGASVIFISHKLPEVLKFSDRISVMRDGKMLKTLLKSEADAEALTELISGMKLSHVKKQPHTEQKGEVALELDNISCTWGLRPLHGISLSVMKGKIVGVLGVDGNGQKELEEIVSGQTARYSGTISIFGSPVQLGSPAALKKMNTGYIPSFREQNGIIPDFTVSENFILGRHNTPPVSGRFILDHKEILNLAEKLTFEYDVQPALSENRMNTLSGGNQQKVVIGREIHRAPAILFACNPARGVDIKTAYATHNRLILLARTGAAILLLLTDISEAMAICDRIEILFNGRLTKTCTPGEYSESDLGYYMNGGI